MTDNENNEGVESLTFFRNQWETMEKIPEAERKELVYAMLAYVFGDREPELAAYPMADLLFSSYRVSLDKTKKRSKAAKSKTSKTEFCSDTEEQAKNNFASSPENKQNKNLLLPESESKRIYKKESESETETETENESETRKEVPEGGETKKQGKESTRVRESARAKKDTPKSFYGEFKNVALTDEQLEELTKKYPYDYMDRIEAVSAYCAQYDKSYKNYYAAIVNWARRDEERAVEKAPDKIAGINKRAAELKAQDDILEAWAAGEITPDRSDFWEVTT